MVLTERKHRKVPYLSSGVQVQRPELKSHYQQYGATTVFPTDPSTQSLSVEYKGASPAVTAVSEQYYKRYRRYAIFAHCR